MDFDDLFWVWIRAYEGVRNAFFISLRTIGVACLITKRARGFEGKNGPSGLKNIKYNLAALEIWLIIFFPLSLSYTYFNEGSFTRYFSISNSFKSVLSLE